MYTVSNNTKATLTYAAKAGILGTLMVNLTSSNELNADPVKTFLDTLSLYNTKQ